MPWIKIDVDFPDHPKVKIVADKMALEREQAAGLLVRWFCWIRKYAPTGHIGNKEFEIPGNFPEKNRKFREALEHSGFLRTEWVNDWPEYGGAEIAEKAKREPEKYKEMIDFYGLLPYGKKTGKKREKTSLEEKRREESTLPVNNDQALFWKAYPKKKSKGDAERAWKQMKPVLPPIAVILDSIAKLKETVDWKKNGGQFIPYPASWLRAKGWEDELPVMERRNTG